MKPKPVKDFSDIHKLLESQKELEKQVDKNYERKLKPKENDSKKSNSGCS